MDIFRIFQHNKSLCRFTCFLFYLKIFLHFFSFWKWITDWNVPHSRYLMGYEFVKILIKLIDSESFQTLFVLIALLRRRLDCVDKVLGGVTWRRPYPRLWCDLRSIALECGVQSCFFRFPSLDDLCFPTALTATFPFLHFLPSLLFFFFLRI